MRKYYYNCKIYDAVSEKNNFDALLVNGDIIEKIGFGSSMRPELPSDAVPVDLQGKYVIPGLIDCHVHMLMSSVNVEEMLMTPRTLGYLRGIRNLEKTLQMGFTTVRDCGGCDVGIKKAIEEGIIKGPRLLTCGILTPTGGHNETYFPIGCSLDIEPGNSDSVYDGIRGVQTGSRKKLREGYDFLKITATGGINDPQTEPFAPEYTVDEIKAIVEISKMRGKDIVVAHCHGGEGLRYCLKGGIRSIEHGTWIDDELMDMMKEKDAYYVPTFAISYYMEEKQKEMNLSSYAVKKHERVKGLLRKSFERALKRGVKIAMGTDAANRDMHGSNAIELKLMVEAGMKPWDALQSATKIAAELLQLKSVTGTLEPGKKADLVVLAKDPLLDFGILLDKNNIYQVIKDGEEI